MNIDPTPGPPAEPTPTVDEMAAELRVCVDQIMAAINRLSRETRSLAQLIAGVDVVSAVQAELRPVAEKLTAVFGRRH